MSKPLVILGHLGLGDHIICNGLVRWIASDGKDIVIPCWSHNQESVAFMFSDLPNVSTMSIGKDCYTKSVEDIRYRAMAGDYRVLAIGSYAPSTFNADRWDQSFYEQAGVPFEQRWAGFKLPPIVNPPTFHGRYTFVHEDAGRGIRIDRSRVAMRGDFEVQPEKTGHIFKWLPAMLGAQDCHLISSSLSALMDSAQLPNCASPWEDWQRHCSDLTLHAYARPGEALPTYRNSKWKILR